MKMVASRVFRSEKSVENRLLGYDRLNISKTNEPFVAFFRMTKEVVFCPNP